MKSIYNDLYNKRRKVTRFFKNIDLIKAGDWYRVFLRLGYEKKQGYYVLNFSGICLGINKQTGRIRLWDPKRKVEENFLLYSPVVQKLELIKMSSSFTVTGGLTKGRAKLYELQRQRRN